MTDPFLRCHRDLDLYLCDFWVMNLKKMNQTKVVFVCDFWVMNLILFEVNQGEMNSMEFWLDVSSANDPLSRMVAGERTPKKIHSCPCGDKSATNST